LALQEARRAVEIDPGDPIGRSNLAATTLGAMGMHNEAFKEWLQYLSVDGDGELAKELETKAKELSDPGDPGLRLAHITLNYYREKMKTQYVAALTNASVYIDLGDKDKMFEWLNKAYEEHSTGLYRGRAALRIATRRSALPGLAPQDEPSGRFFQRRRGSELTQRARDPIPTYLHIVQSGPC
jgi:tetratricopeptide (TPR) repeat protein